MSSLYVPSELPDDYSIAEELDKIEKQMHQYQKDLDAWAYTDWSEYISNEYKRRVCVYEKQLEHFNSQSEEYKEMSKKYDELQDEYNNLCFTRNKYVDKKMYEASLRKESVNLHTTFLNKINSKIRQLSEQFDKYETVEFVEYPEEPKITAEEVKTLKSFHDSQIGQFEKELNIMKKKHARLERMKLEDQWRKAYKLYAENNQVSCDMSDDDDLFPKCHEHYKTVNGIQEDVKIGIIGI